MFSVHLATHITQQDNVYLKRDISKTSISHVHRLVLGNHSHHGVRETHQKFFTIHFIVSESEKIILSCYLKHRGSISFINGSMHSDFTSCLPVNLIIFVLLLHVANKQNLETLLTRFSSEDCPDRLQIGMTILENILSGLLSSFYGIRHSMFINLSNIVSTILWHHY